MVILRYNPDLTVSFLRKERARTRSNPRANYTLSGRRDLKYLEARIGFHRRTSVKFDPSHLAKSNRPHIRSYPHGEQSQEISPVPSSTRCVYGTRRTRDATVDG